MAANIDLSCHPEWAEQALRLYAEPTNPSIGTVVYWLRNHGFSVSDAKVRRFLATRVAQRALELLRKVPRRIVRLGEVIVNHKRYRVPPEQIPNGKAVLVMPIEGTENFVSLHDTVSGCFIAEAALVTRRDWSPSV